MAGIINSNIPTTLIHNTLTEGQEVSEALTIVAGAKSVSVRNMGAADGIFDGMTIGPDEVFNYPWVGTTYDDIEVNGAGTTLKIFVFR